MLRKKSRADKEIERMMEEFNSELDRRIEEVKPDDETLNDYIDNLIQRNKPSLKFW